MQYLVRGICMSNPFSKIEKSDNFSGNSPSCKTATVGPNELKFGVQTIYVIQNTYDFFQDILRWSLSQTP